MRQIANAATLQSTEMACRALNRNQIPIPYIFGTSFRPNSPPKCSTMQSLVVMSHGGFEFLERKLGLPDIGLNKRRQIIQRFFQRPIDRRNYEELLAPNFVMVDEECGAEHQFSRPEFIDVMCNRIAPAIPDFKWSAATDGEIAVDGFALVFIDATGHHTGAPLDLGSHLEPLPPSGKRFKLPQAIKKVKVEGGKILEIRAIGEEGTGPLAIYTALGGKLK